MKKKYYWIVGIAIIILVVLSGFILFEIFPLPPVNLGPDPYSCDTACLLVSGSNDPNLKGIACISEDYYNLNNPKYHYELAASIPENPSCDCINNSCSYVTKLPMASP